MSFETYEVLPDPLRRSGQPPLVLTNGRNDQVVAHTLLRAFDSASRNQGLLKRDFLEEGSALVIAPTNAIHTFFMRFAIDVAFVAKRRTRPQGAARDAAVAHVGGVGWVCGRGDGGRRPRSRGCSARRPSSHRCHLKKLTGTK